MTIKRTYFCNLCAENVPLDPIAGRVLVGLYWEANSKLVERAPRDVEHHICNKCLSALQKFKPICGDGMRGCTGGPDCQSDHK